MGARGPYAGEYSRIHTLRAYPTARAMSPNADRIGGLTCSATTVRTANKAGKVRLSGHTLMDAAVHRRPAGTPERMHGDAARVAAAPLARVPLRNARGYALAVDVRAL